MHFCLEIAAVVSGAALALAALFLVTVLLTSFLSVKVIHGFVYCALSLAIVLKLCER